MAHWFVVDDLTGRVATTTEWDGESDHGEVGYSLYPYDETVQVGWYRRADGSYDDGTFEEYKVQMKQAVMSLLQEKFQEGFSPSTGPLAGHTLQCRDTEDRTNWLTSQTSYMAAIQMGYGAVPGASFRTMGNETVTVTFQEGLEVLTSGMAVWGKNLMGHSWTLKDAIEEATSIEELNAIDITADWPTA